MMSKAHTTLMALRFPHSFQQLISVWFAEADAVRPFPTWSQYDHYCRVLTCVQEQTGPFTNTLTHELSHTPSLHCLKLCLSIYSTLLSCVCGTCIVRPCPGLVRPGVNHSCTRAPRIHYHVHTFVWYCFWHGFEWVRVCALPCVSLRPGIYTSQCAVYIFQFQARTSESCMLCFVGNARHDPLST